MPFPKLILFCILGKTFSTMKLQKLILLLFTTLALLSFSPQRITIFEQGARISGKWCLMYQLTVDSSQNGRDSAYFPMDTSSFFSFEDNGKFSAWIQSVFDTTGIALNEKYVYNKTEKHIIIADGQSKDTFAIQTLIHNKMTLFRNQTIFSDGVKTTVKQWTYLKRK